ncbi:WhiB family transcriptional regulator [Streptacidiphilus sp. P02-A3a]|uniref:WhiB family transcriptional regulator n=1 Tax=Streptacidiphilus sp. P02-A3a TaxID=2704468 RepID=UPI0015FDA38B|nr:WhiB family transcriptional regulator [Streptacidiphilus sp. P02-A3a]QMU69868.1 WhiB family transcriptional regulator [Streptacidiphilus sp. P02-A3a]
MGTKSELPGSVEWAWAWQEQAACARAERRLFFHPAGERGRTFEARERAAKRVCASCPVLAQCREYAIQSRERYGVWGGLSEDERAALLRRRRTARATEAA